jgi:SAM-dependent methyltransferase
MRNGSLGSSFRDPSGFLFTREGVLYRQVNRVRRENYDGLMAGGLYAELTEAGLLIPHAEVDDPPAAPEIAYRVLRPERVGFISYPYEWSFSQLKDAALATLAIQARALARGMSLKDASAYNIQFHRGRPLLIDTLSFEKLREGEPWVAYRQFCQHFLAPLALMARRDIRLGQLLRVHLDGVPLDLACALLPARTRWQLGLAMHLHAHAASQRRYADKPVRAPRGRFGPRALQGLVESLGSTVRRLQWRPRGTEWAEYYRQTNYSDAAIAHKEELVGRFLEICAPRTVWDLGANTGRFGRIASGRGIDTVASDIDPAAVEIAYLEARRRADAHLLPLLSDLTNPSPAQGWAHDERMSLLERGPADLALALALVHHLAISNNVPLDRLARFFARTARALVIEFVPKSDSQVQRLLATREDVFPDYRRDTFEAAFTAEFEIAATEPVRESQRTLYFMRARRGAP